MGLRMLSLELYVHPSLQCRSLLGVIDRLTSSVSGSYCTGEAGLVANSASSANALLQSREEHDRIQAAAEAERQAVKAEQERNGIKRKEAVGWTKHQEGDEVELDKSRLKKALDEEKKRKNLSEDEIMARAKTSKSDVSHEEMGKPSLNPQIQLGKKDLLLTSVQRLTDYRNKLTMTPWPTTRMKMTFKPSRDIDCIAIVVLSYYLTTISVFIMYNHHHYACSVLLLAMIIVDGIRRRQQALSSLIQAQLQLKRPKT